MITIVYIQSFKYELLDDQKALCSRAVVNSCLLTYLLVFVVHCDVSYGFNLHPMT